MVVEGAAVGRGGAPAAPWRLDEERLRVYSWLIAVIFGVVYAGWIGLSLPGLIDPSGQPLGFDFLAFWSAARLAVEGRPEAAYDWVAIGAAHHLAVPGIGNRLSLWHYPPTFLLPLYPLGLLSYLPALLLFNGATAVGWTVLCRRLLPERGLWILGLALPAALTNIMLGQNGLLTATVAGFALLLLDGEPVMAGCLIGLLAIKPHLAVLFPVALIATGRWRAFVAAAVTALLLLAASLAAFGAAPLWAFFHNLGFARELIDVGFRPIARMPSAYVFSGSLGVPASLAMALQVTVAAAAGICVWVAWRSPAAPFEAKAATLALASLLVSPYVFNYDLTWAGLAMAWLGLLGRRRGFLSGERGLLLLAWAAPVLMLVPVKVSLGFPLLVALLALAMRRALLATPLEG